MDTYNQPVIKLGAPASGKLEGQVRLPGSKSETNRGWVLAAQLPGLQMRNASDSDDSRVLETFAQLAKAGCGANAIELGHAGAAARFLSALACTTPGIWRLDGSERLRQRPLAPLIDSLRAAGATIKYAGENKGLPIEIEGDAAWKPMRFTVDSTQSSQFVSALLLLAPRLPLGCEIRLEPFAFPSAPYAAMTLNMLKQVGYGWQHDPELPGFRLTEARFVENPSLCIESDWSSASYWLGMAALLPANLALRTLCPDSLQGDALALRHFNRLGVQTAFEADGTLRVLSQPSKKLLSFKIDFSDMPDVAQTFAVLARYACGPCTLTGLETLPYKETNRISSTAFELAGAGSMVEFSNADMKVSQPDFAHAFYRIRTFNDHRMALAFSLLAARHKKVVIENPAVVGKSYPTYWAHLREVGFRVEEP